MRILSPVTRSLFWPHEHCKAISDGGRLPKQDIGENSKRQQCATFCGTRQPSRNISLLRQIDPDVISWVWMMVLAKRGRGREESRRGGNVNSPRGASPPPSSSPPQLLLLPIIVFTKVIRCTVPPSAYSTVKEQQHTCLDLSIERKSWHAVHDNWQLTMLPIAFTKVMAIDKAILIKLGQNGFLTLYCRAFSPHAFHSILLHYAILCIVSSHPKWYCTYTLHYITLQCIAPSYPTDTGSTTWLLSIASPRPLLHCNHHHHPHNHHHHHHHQYHHHYHHHHHGHTGSKWLISPQATNAPFWQHCEVLQKLFLVQMGAHLSQGAAPPTNDTDTDFIWELTT